MKTPRERRARGDRQARRPPAGGRSRSPTIRATSARCARTSPTDGRRARSTARGASTTAPGTTSSSTSTATRGSASTSTGRRRQFAAGARRARRATPAPLHDRKGQRVPELQGRSRRGRRLPLAAVSQQRIQDHYHASQIDTTAPPVSLATPGDGTHDDRHDPDLPGTAGTALGDSTTVTVRSTAELRRDARARP